MDKTYFYNIVPADFGIFAFYGVIFYLLLALIMHAMNYRSYQNHLIVASIFILYHILVPLDYKFNFIPFLPDSILYNFMFETGIPPANYSSSLIGFYTVISFFRIVLIENILAYISFQILVYFVAILIMLKSWNLLYKHAYSNTFSQIFLTLSLLLPSSILYNVVPLRECFTALAFAVTLYFLTLLFKNFSIINSGFLAGLFMIIFTRMQVAIYFLLSFLGLKIYLDKNIPRKVMVGVLGTVMFLVFLFITNYQLSPKKLEFARNYRVDTYTHTYGKVSWSSYNDIIKAAPELMTQFLLSPLPIVHKFNPLEFKLALMDSIVVLLVLAIIALNLPNIIKNHSYWFFLILLYLILFGIYEFSIIGAVRHRLPMTILLIALAANQLTTLITKYPNKEEYK